jgi:hypothetical protein
MSGREETLTARQEKALLALLAEPTVDAAAAAVGVTPRTLWRWQQEPAFRAALLALRREVFGTATTRLAAASTEAVAALREALTNPDSSWPARVSAARTILERAAAAIELEDLSERLAAVEARLGEQNEA